MMSRWSCTGAKIGVVGPNSAGKSTMLKIMAGLEQPSHGEAMLAPGLAPAFCCRNRCRGRHLNLMSFRTDRSDI